MHHLKIGGIFCPYLCLSEHPRLIFIQPINVPHQQRSIHGVDAKKHVCTPVPVAQ